MYLWGRREVRCWGAGYSRVCCVSTKAGKEARWAVCLTARFNDHPVLLAEVAAKEWREKG